MCDGRDDDFDSGGRCQKHRHHRHDRHAWFGRGAGYPFQRVALLGAYRSKQGNALTPLSESATPFDGQRLSKVLLRYS